MEYEEQLDTNVLTTIYLQVVSVKVRQNTVPYTISMYAQVNENSFDLKIRSIGVV